MAASDVTTELSSLPQADQEAIGATLVALRTSFQERDADKLVGVYSADADWVNAFGSVKKGSDEIVH
jgi:ketosteroid isomerase-like protein